MPVREDIELEIAQIIETTAGIKLANRNDFIELEIFDFDLGSVNASILMNLIAFPDFHCVPVLRAVPESLKKRVLLPLDGIKGFLRIRALIFECLGGHLKVISKYKFKDALSEMLS